MVMLLHGIASSNRKMVSMQRRLSHEGYHVVNLPYPSTEYPIEVLADSVLGRSVARYCTDAPKLHFVTNSMGGIVLRYYLRDRQPENLGRVVMISPPNQGTEAVDFLTGNCVTGTILGWMRGQAGYQLGTDPLTSIPIQLGRVDFELGVVAGDRTIEPWFSMVIPGRDDGKVAVERCKVEGMTDFIVMPHSHTFNVRSADTIEQTIHFLRNGEFNHSPER